MKAIQKLVDQIKEELEGAKNYAEEYLTAKANGDKEWSQNSYEAAQDELKHAMFVHNKAVKDIQKLYSVYDPPVEMVKEWDMAHKEYMEQTAWIKQMLSI